MEVDLFFHGVPSGESFWGKTDDKDYFSTFYDGGTDIVKFLIQCRSVNGKQYCYYNYLLYNNIVSNNGRPGSHFDMSLRFDAYCKDFANVYRILDLLFNTMVKGDILTSVQDKLKYSLSDFASVDSKLNNIQNKAIEIISSSFKGDSFITLSGFSVSDGNFPILNLYDCNNDTVLSALKKYGKIALSPYYVTRREQELKKQCESSIVNFQKQCDTTIREKEHSFETERINYNHNLSSAKQEMVRLQSEVEQKDKQIVELRHNNDELNAQIKKIGQVKKINEIVDSLKKPVNDLNTLLDEFTMPQHNTAANQKSNKNKKNPDSPKSKSYFEKRNNKIILWSIVILVFIVILFLFYVRKDGNTSSETKETSQRENVISNFSETQNKQESANYDGANLANTVNSSTMAFTNDDSTSIK